VPWWYRYTIQSVGNQLEVPWQWRYKAICNYNNDEILLDDIDVVINSSSVYDLYIECTTSQDNLHTYLEVKDRNNPNARFYGDWWVYLPEGSYTLISNADGVRTDAGSVQESIPAVANGGNPDYRPYGKIRIERYGIHSYATFFVAVATSGYRPLA